MELSAVIKAQAAVSFYQHPFLIYTRQNLQSNMSIIPSGAYNISNAMYPNLYFAMSGNKEFVGRDVADIIQVKFQDEDTTLATLYDTASQLYIGFNMGEQKVTGYTDPQKLQLSTSWENSLVIQDPSTAQVCYFQDGSEGSSIDVGEESGDSNQRWRFLVA
ncbi:hypothetical protein BDR07DRAFT_1605036 [Suillus spraguei]|nr:hypothetical protein BDR07DRAFT_1605036 [Suillus spraguei]